MGDFSKFLKKNKAVKKHIKIAATKSLQDESGNPLEWEVRPLTTVEDNEIREACTFEVQVPGKPNLYRSKFNANKYLAKVAAQSVVYPNLNDKELQDSYGVMCAEDLITQMIDDPGEYNGFMNRIQEYHGFLETMQEKVDTAKN